MDHRAEIREFLVSRRARVEPEQVGLPHGTDRRVPGLRRGEAAMLAGVSVEYYARLERGAVAGASDAVLDGLASALRMDEAERDHLFRLARSTAVSPKRSPSPHGQKEWKPSTSVKWMLDSIEGSIAMIGNGRLDLLAWNPLGRAFVDEMIATTLSGPPNFARFTFFEPAARAFYPDWELAADMSVAMLRTEAGRRPHSRELHELVGELSTRSDYFRQRWGNHDVRQHDTGVKHFHHHIVGGLVLNFNSFEVIGEPGTRLTVYAAEPGSSTDDALRLLASWGAKEFQHT